MAATLLLLCLLPGCSKHAEPRWLVRALPGRYPEVVYFVPTKQQAIALTIDDGVDPATTPKILDVLKAHRVTATFFIVTNSLPGQQSLVQRLLREGHELGHHMTEDRVTVKLDDQELTRRFNYAADRLEGLAHINWFRPGSGRYDKRMLKLVRERGYRIAMASVAPLDTMVANPRRVSNYINWMVEPGSIIVLHDVGARGQRTASTLESLLPRLLARNYKVMSLSQLDQLRQSSTIRPLGSESGGKSDTPSLQQTN